MGDRVGEIRRLLWGGHPNERVFRSWSQGFTFSSREPSALVQLEGGPCAVLAPVQAFILRDMVAAGDISAKDDEWRFTAVVSREEHLVSAICSILLQARNGDSDRPLLAAELCGVEGPLVDYLGSDFFHDSLTLRMLETRAELRQYYMERVPFLFGVYGVQLLLYSVVATRGCAALREEMNDTSEPMIDSVHGYANQSLINLMLTGRGVANVWDDDRDVGGMTMRGIEKQSEIGFLALLESTGLCEVGLYLKNPKNPVWVLASETHLSVLFAIDTNLAGDETPAMMARRVFRSFDAMGARFVSRALLPDILAALGMSADPEVMEVLARHLDLEGCGIILETVFMRELFPEDPPPDTFVLYHYNGLSGSSHNGDVVYQKAQAFMSETMEPYRREGDDVSCCLQTKWPGLQLQWQSGLPPSIN